MSGEGAQAIRLGLKAQERSLQCCSAQAIRHGLKTGEQSGIALRLFRMASRLRSSLGRALRPFSMASRHRRDLGRCSGHSAWPQDWGAVWDSAQAIRNGLETEEQSGKGDQAIRLGLKAEERSGTALRPLSMAS
uniref:Uncharacterized protein n=1 Tax=Bracon brevicornis TaxID=1563983 RepID=A0A6V7LCN2_9HYME